VECLQTFGVAEKHNFCNIQQKILQISDFAKNRDLNPPPHGVWPKNMIFAVYSKKFRKFPISLKNGIRTPHPIRGFRVKKHNFCENPIGFLQNSPDCIQKIGFREKLFSRFL
jgi:hypothetical protein